LRCNTLSSSAAAGRSGGEVILGEPEVIQASQQRLTELIRRQQGHAQADLLLQHVELLQDQQRLHRWVMLGRNPQRSFKQRRGRMFQAGEKGVTGVHCILRRMLPF
jgi:hypothetical protein